MEDLVETLCEELLCSKIAVTHGHNDTLMYSMYSADKFYKIPIFSNEVKDTIGAGDAFFSITALCVANDFPTDVVGFIGNAVGALKVRTVCNRSSVEPNDLFEFIKELLCKTTD